MAIDQQTQPERFPIEQLLNASAFPHPVSRLRVIETHISWIVLTGDYAYKIKKPVKFDFVDYSTLEDRRLNCEKEVLLNQRYTEGIYLGVVPIHDREGHYVVSDQLLSAEQSDAVPAVEYAVKMREFDQDAILAHRLKQHAVPTEMMDQFAATLAEFHQQEPAVEVDDLESELSKIHGEVTDNFVLLRRALKNTSQANSIEQIDAWSETQFEFLCSQIQDRVRHGFLKKCHGDLHLNNIIQFEDHLVPFDGIEFNEHLQTIDTLNEVAFPFMDLMAHHYPEHSWRFLTAYLEKTSGYAALKLFRFFTVYRAMVRAKVAWIHCQVKSSTSGHNSSWLKGDIPDDHSRKEPVHPWDHYLAYAEQAIAPQTPTLSITFGFSGSGKSTHAMRVVEKEGAIRLRSDVRRQELKQQQLSSPLYSPETTDRIYRQLLDDAKSTLKAGYSVVVDATFLAQHHRQWFEQLAQGLECDFRILACDANFAELCERIQNRSDDPSEATIAVLQQQMKQFDPLSAEERQYAIQLPLT